MFIMCGCQCLAVKCAWLLAVSASCFINPTPATFLLPAVDYSTGVCTQDYPKGNTRPISELQCLCCTGLHGVDSSIRMGR